MTDHSLLPAEFAGLDLLATMVVVTSAAGECLFANAAFEDTMRLSRRAVQRAQLPDWFDDAQRLLETLDGVAANHYSSSRFDAVLRRGAWAHEDGLPVHVIVSQMEASSAGTPRVLVELIEIGQLARQDRDERNLDQVQATKELTRNLAHEIKNPLGGIRGAAQLLALELQDGSPELTEYTQVIVHEVDRLQSLVDRLLAPHRKAQVVGDVNIHEICERVRALVLIEHPKGLAIQRDYDTSLPDFRGDREQLIQMVLNIVQNAAQVLGARMAAGDAQILLRTRVARQVTIGKQRWRLALELHVEDNGPGIPAEIRDRIFFPLVSGREGGSGLGLTLAQTVAQQHQGMIDCESEPGKTNFRITLPLP
ncbi:nitrogen regulation protein NR(II) [Pelomonas sp. UHG3]|jgi:two-component system nitrogen regulation sensor histidine kinase GlnL|uniref:Nitrogen regulation protein NR(II) n=1 Tax=Roseateles hydrophilus TaxID=2975054 RepID=A0ACC6CE87_9BURK|nr:nitrogen regulation protein NR(II) [Pelomonas sp. UHG3]MCY4746615.1 nitrogen regulation protein NR(II) [Pelomonas sp. UHG3]